MSIIFATGPLVSKVSRKEAKAAIEANEDFPKGAEVALEQLDGHWVAAVHTAEFPLPKGGGPADAEEEAPGPKSEKPDDAEPSDDPDDGGDDEGDDGAPPFGKEDKGDGDGEDKHEEKGEEHLLVSIHDALQKLMVALGIPDQEAEGPVPGEDVAPAPPGPPGGPHGPAGPKSPDETIEHTRALKPGETPPGGTPVGAPAFASTRFPWGNDHPWEPLIGVKASFEVAEEIPNEHTFAAVDQELNSLCRGPGFDTGFKVKQIAEDHNPRTGRRIARALISAY